jgi:hypothetical protein
VRARPLTNQRKKTATHRRTSRQEKLLGVAVAIMGGVEASPGETAALYFRRMAREHPVKFMEGLADLFFPEPPGGEDDWPS